MDLSSNDDLLDAVLLGWFGPDAFPNVRTLLCAVAELTPAELVGPVGVRSDYARRQVRMLCTLIPGDVVADDGLAGPVLQLMGNPLLTVDIVQGVIRGNGREVSGAKLRDLAEYMRMGHSKRRAAEFCRVDKKVAEHVYAFLDLGAARDCRALSTSIHAVATGETAAEYASTERISRYKANKLLTKARLTLAELGLL